MGDEILSQVKTMLLALTGSEGQIATNLTQSGSGVGKDEVARILVEKHGFVHLKFADALRDFVYKKYQLDFSKKGNKDYENSTFIFKNIPANDTKNHSRYFTVQELLVLESEEQRSVNPYIWIDDLITKITNNTSKNYVISDLRQWNELCILKLVFKAYIVNIVRPNPSRPRRPLDCHLIGSEDFNLHNLGDIKELEENVKRLIENIRSLEVFPNGVFINEDLLFTQPWKLQQ